MNKKVLKILGIISILIIVFGIICGIFIKNQLIKEGMPTENVIFDGGDITKGVELFTIVGSHLFGIVIVIYSVLIVAGIWVIYGITILIIKVIQKIKNKNK